MSSENETAKRLIEEMDWIGDSPDLAWLEGAIAEAIMAERERCAKIVDEWPENDSYIDQIVAAIRAG